MDEDRANIDMKTEEKIQKALQYVLNYSTIIIVAHRIKTIINYGKILVLNNGKIEEFDTHTEYFISYIPNPLCNKNSTIHFWNIFN